jgi:hypothetical protein
MVPFGIMPSRTPLPDSTIYISRVLYFSKYISHEPDGDPIQGLRGDARDCEVRSIPLPSISRSRVRDSRGNTDVMVPLPDGVEWLIPQPCSSIDYYCIYNFTKSDEYITYREGSGSRTGATAGSHPAPFYKIRSRDQNLIVNPWIFVYFHHLRNNDKNNVSLKEIPESLIY